MSERRNVLYVYRWRKLEGEDLAEAVWFFMSCRAGATDLGFEPRSLPTAFRAPFSFGHDLGSQRVAWVLAEVRLVFPLWQRKGVSGRVRKVILVFKKLGLHPSLSFRGFSRPRPICSIRPADFMTHSRLIAGTSPFSLFFK
jgi:hypothetical protein